jgi:hypothetical protein
MLGGNINIERQIAAVIGEIKIYCSGAKCIKYVKFFMS